MPDLLPPAAPDNALHMPGLAEVLLNVTSSGLLLLRPVYAADGVEIIDFSWGPLNAAAQQMLGLPARPTESFLTLFPTAVPHGVFGFYRDAFVSGEVARRNNLYQHDGLDGYYALVAQRHADVLAVSFTDANDQPRTAVEEALRASQARELAARADAEAERATLQRTLDQAPVAIAILEGPNHVITFANAEMALIWGRSPTSLQGRPHFEALPDLAGQGFEAIFADVYQTGKPYYLQELPVDVDRQGRGQAVRGYYNILYHPLYDASSAITGIVASATEVTEQVLTRQQVQQLNDELEVRVAERTAEAQAALREAQTQREQLREQQGLLRQILGQVPASVATLIGPQHRFAFFNDQYQALSAGRVELGLTVAEVFPEVVAQGFVALLDKVYATGEPFIGKDVSVQLLDPGTGQPGQRYVDFVYQPLRDGQGQIQGILAFIIDTTETVLARRQADTLQAAALAAVQRRAQKRQELYQIFAQTPVAIVLLREPDHRIDYFNPAFEELFPPEEWTSPLQSHRLDEVYPRIKMAGLMELLDRVFETGETQVIIDMPLANLQPGSPRYVTLSYQAYREEGRIVGVAAFAYNVTEQVLGRREAETMQAELLAGAQRRAQARQDLLSLFERAPVAVVLLREPEHRIEYYNEAFERLYPGENLRGRFLREAYPDLTIPDVLDRLDRVYQTGETYVGLEDRLRTTAPGPARYISFTYQPYREDDRIAGVAVFIYEVTEQVLGRQQVQALNEELAAINKEMQATNEELYASNTLLTRTNADLDTFVYSASHDLKSPITNIEGLLLALRQQLPAEAQDAPLVPRLLEMMDGAVARFQETLGYLTDVTRLQQAQADQPAEAVDLPALVEAVRLDILPELTAAGATLTLDLAGCRAVYFAPKNLRSILYNLLSNAIKYHDPTRAALVQLQAHTTPTGLLVLEVQDNGLGLTLPQQGELFQLFRRLHSHVAGSGVGLYMVKKMVDNAGGTLAVHSEPGVGSTFTVTLPMAYRAQP